MNGSGSLALSDDAIRAFWQWFSTHQCEVARMLDMDDTAGLARVMNEQMDALTSGLAWEIGPGLVEPYMLVLPAEGDVNRRMVIARILEAAPRLEGWEFHSARPTRPFQPEVRLPDKHLTFQSSKWRFRLAPSANSDRFDLEIFDDELATHDQTTGLTAAFILLDAVLGEDIVERWIGNIQILPRDKTHGNSLPMPAISERLAELVPR